MAPKTPRFAVNLHGQRFIFGHTLTDIVHVAESVKAHEVAQGCALFVATQSVVKIAVLYGCVGYPEKGVSISH